jgi:hypothetical protein
MRPNDKQVTDEETLSFTTKDVSEVYEEKNGFVQALQKRSYITNKRIHYLLILIIVLILLAFKMRVSQKQSETPITTNPSVVTNPPVVTDPSVVTNSPVVTDPPIMTNLPFSPPDFPLNELLVTPSEPKRSREWYANITRQVYNLYFDEIASRKDVLPKKMLIGIPTGAYDFQRRALVRSYQIDPYKDKYDITFKFILGNPPLEYMPGLEYENKTYGDILILWDIPDDRQTGRTLKSPEFYKYVEKHMPEYKYIGRMDTDCYAELDRFWAKYFNETVQELEFAYVAAYIRTIVPQWEAGFLNDWPHGAFYVISWKMMLMFNRFWNLVPREIEYDDQMMGRYNYDTGLNCTDVKFETEETVEFSGNLNFNKKVIRVHELKYEMDYIRVALALAPALAP